jgi:hypothetical protein
VPTPQELERKFWKATLMLGLDGVEDGHARPMTAQLAHDDRGPIFFSAKDAPKSMPWPTDLSTFMPTA